MRWFFGFFLVSGFCSLVYQVVWLRLCMAAFGVTTPMVSIVLSVFMAGLALGSWGAGRLLRSAAGPASLPLRLYAMAELLIAASGDSMPWLLGRGHALLARGGDAVSWASWTYHAASGGWVTLCLLPFCTCMGATFPLAMGAIRRSVPREAAMSFSYLYVANVLGASLGTLLSAFVLIELLGFRGTLHLTAGLNALLAAAALLLSLAPSPSVDLTRATGEGTEPPSAGLEGRWLLAALFSTGLVSMAMEVVWVRQFTAYLGNVVYAFATILAVYLLATFAGSRLYRVWARDLPRTGRQAWGLRLWAWVGLFGLLPLAAADPRWLGPLGLGRGALRVVLGIPLFSAALGFLTPMLVDRWSSGDPDRAGSAYAVNVVGCILGPLLAAFGFLPLLGERASLAALAVPLFGLGYLAARAAAGTRTWTVPVALSLLLLAVTRDYETLYPNHVLGRDSTATVIAYGRGMQRRLLVNGVGMTSLTPIAKMMVHLPLALHQSHPESVLNVCFGMGTSFRSALSWGIRSTAVELVPSVPPLMGFFHADAPELLASPRARIVIDDGRRFLERTRQDFDVIVVDPPPPPQAAGSSLLYSVEFYRAARRRLEPDGILETWIPWGEPPVIASFARALAESFPHVRVFGSVEGWGIHLVASDRPLPRLSAAELAARLPPDAVRDLLEWGPETTAEAQFQKVLSREVTVQDLLAPAPGVRALRDDAPINEYYLLRAALAFWLRPGHAS